ncbi:lipopolysaccharide transport system ATP binding protein [Candidatus Methylacidithermus pantelleriae]|uniref:Lipopolysaccharide transport system ATP binding protein n=2 Tax=Candidatus Methylacidithermus pantelleriae TaxID=2744239 RepID=A0A8J2FS14_9BACT|nr:lipopolysaccharide transport system ATP binding protein [Candidatus Methylacidithermus pantelleriae]
MDPTVDLRDKRASVPESNRLTPPSLLRAEKLVKEFRGRRVVQEVSLEVARGEIVGLLGPNGAGKSTTFRMLVGLVRPNSGRVFLGEEDITHLPLYQRARRGIGYLPQEESVFQKLTVEENLMAILEFLEMTPEERRAHCHDLLRDFGLESVRDTLAISLSGGEKKRLAIARCLITSPNLFLLDEPFSGVDPLAVYDLQQIIVSLRDRGIGILITDHNVRETLAIVDRAYLICEGRVVRHGTSEFLIHDPVSRELYLGPRFSM